MKQLFLLFAVAALACGAAPLRAQTSYKVVANEAAGVATMSAADLNKVFMKHDTKLPGGGSAAPVNLAVGPVREAFSRDVHGRSATAVASYWQQQIFSGKDVPPAEKATDAEVLAFVRSTRGAIGYIASGTAVPAGVIVVTVK